jgi:hypothetical protein
MAELDELRRNLALARSALGAPSDTRARVLARLAAGQRGGGQGGANAAGARPEAPLAAGGRVRAFARALTWASLGVCAGYWLGFHRIGASLVEAGAVRASAGAAAVVVHGPVDVPIGVSSPAAGDALENHAETAPGRAVPTVSASEAGPEHVPARAREPARAVPPRRGPRSAAAALAAQAPPRAVENRLGAEIALLERIERAIRAGEGALALALLDQLEREFPTSSLNEERAAARVLARCTEARTAGPAERAAAHARAEQFLSQSSSVYADRVRELCELGE